jgi:hypothetical protein
MSWAARSRAKPDDAAGRGVSCSSTTDTHGREAGLKRPKICEFFVPPTIDCSRSKTLDPRLRTIDCWRSKTLDPRLRTIDCWQSKTLDPRLVSPRVRSRRRGKPGRPRQRVHFAQAKYGRAQRKGEPARGLAAQLQPPRRSSRVVARSRWVAPRPGSHPRAPKNPVRRSGSK